MNRVSTPVLRQASVLDVPAMTDIYAHHVMHGTGSFEEQAPSQQVMQQRWQSREDDAYPSLIAELDGVVVGFAYAGNYKPRSAYRFTVEDSIYVAPDHVGQGIGKLMLQRLIDICSQAGYRQMMAVIGDSENRSSIALHESCGFSHVGTAHALGFKFGRWLDIVYMQRNLVDCVTPR